MSSITEEKRTEEKIDLDLFVAEATKNGMVCFDIEHPPELNRHKPGFRLAGCGFSTGVDENNPDSGIVFYETNLVRIAKLIDALVLNPELEAIAYNGKYDVQCLKAAGLMRKDEYPNLVDPMIGVNLLDDNRRPNQIGLDKVVYDAYKYKMASFKEAWLGGEKSDKFKRYAEDDVRWEYIIWNRIKPKLEQQKLMSLFSKILCPVSMIFSDAESKGIKWDISQARVLLRKFQKMRAKLETSIFKQIGPLNLNSGPQLAKRLFDELEFSTKGLEKTNSGDRWSVDAKAMDTLAFKYPICDKIRSYRTCAKMISTYIEPLTRLALDDQNERVHPTFWVVSATGRTRSSDPNLQNIPNIHFRKGFEDLNVRNAFIAKEGCKLLVADLSQIELRIIAHITQDPLFMQSYLEWQCTKCKSKGKDEIILHECPKCGCDENEAILKDSTIPGFWHGLDLHQMTTDNIAALHGDRQNGKTANFALVYYATARKMHFEYPDLSERQWQEVIDGFFDLYTGVHAWHLRMDKKMWENPTAIDIFGRRRRLRKADIKRNPKNALNMFINFVPQSSACAMIELAIVNMWKEWTKEKTWLNKVSLVNMIHDEIVLEVEEDSIDQISSDVIQFMEHSVKLKVPVRTSLQITDRWGSAK